MIPARRTNGELVVFFDGVCGLCNRLVDVILRADKSGKILLAPLQGDTAKRTLGKLAEDLDSMYATEGGVTYSRSSAVIRICTAMGGIYRVLGVLAWIVPKPIRELGYRIVARYRYGWFGKSDACRLPTAEERARFLP